LAGYGTNLFDPTEWVARPEHGGEGRGGRKS